MNGSAVQAGKRATYPAYRPSGVEWLDELPEHWQVKRLKFLFRFRNGGTPSTNDPSYWAGDIPWVSSKDMKVFRLNDTADHITEEAIAESATTLVPSATILMVVRSGILRHTIPVAVTQREMAINQDIKALIPTTERLLPDYMAYLVSGNQSQLLTLWRKEGTTVESLEVEAIQNFGMLLPPLGEQQAIASFLDRETARIDALVEKKQRQIELLQEKRFALISHAVTSGLDPNAPMKDSGIRWLGKIPRHWGVPRLGYCASVFNGATPSRSRPDYWSDGTVPWLASAKVNADFIEVPSEWITETARRECGLAVVPAGSVVIGIVGQGRTRGTCALMGLAATINQNMAAIVPNHGLNGRFLHFALQHMYEPIREYGRGANQAALNCEQVADLRIPLPPSDEQGKIVEYLDGASHQEAALRNSIEGSARLLREYRTALVSAAVTGKIDVRGEE